MCESTQSRSLELVQDAIRCFYNEFKDNPYEYLYESDIQVSLAAKLKCLFAKEMGNNGREFNYLQAPAGCKGEFLNPVKTEYLKKFDIAVLSSEGCEMYKDESDILMALYHKKVEIAIELKYFAYQMPNGSGFEKDLQKLLDCKKYNCCSTGIAIYFYQEKKYFDKEAYLKERIIQLGYLPSNLEKFHFTKGNLYAIRVYPEGFELFEKQPE